MKTNYFFLYFFFIILTGCSDDKITPELPLAPRREPLEIALHKAAISASSPSAETSLAADMIVIDMFEPVSPSATGNTYNT